MSEISPTDSAPGPEPCLEPGLEPGLEQRRADRPQTAWHVLMCFAANMVAEVFHRDQIDPDLFTTKQFDFGFSLDPVSGRHNGPPRGHVDAVTFALPSLGLQTVEIGVQVSERGQLVHITWDFDTDRLRPFRTPDEEVVVVGVSGGVARKHIHVVDDPDGATRGAAGGAYTFNALAAQVHGWDYPWEQERVAACLAAAHAAPERTPQAADFAAADALVQAAARETMEEYLAYMLDAAAKTYGFPSLAAFSRQHRPQAAPDEG